MKSKIFGYFIIITIVLLIGVTYLENVVYNEVENDKIIAIDSTTVDSLLADSVVVDSLLADSVVVDSLLVDSVAVDSLLVDSVAADTVKID